MSGILNSEIEAGTLLQVEWMFFKGNSSAVFVLTWNENLSDNDILNRTLMFLKKCHILRTIGRYIGFVINGVNVETSSWSCGDAWEGRYRLGYSSLDYQSCLWDNQQKHIVSYVMRIPANFKINPCWENLKLPTERRAYRFRVLKTRNYLEFHSHIAWRSNGMISRIETLLKEIDSYLF